MDEPSQAPEGYYPPEEPPQQKPSTSLPVIAGILLIIAALSGFLTSYGLFTADTSTIQSVLPPNSPITAQDIQTILKTCTIISFIFSAVALVGGLLALRKRSWGITILGSVLGLFTIGVYYTASAFSLIALVFLIMSRREFT